MEKFTLAPDGVDPAKVPTRTLYSGARIPAIGLGTFGSDRFTADQVAAAVRGAIAVGYRHIDCASVYGNEPQIGAVLQEVLDSGAVKREDLWITSKVWNDMHGKGDVLLSCARSLRDLRLDYLDLYLVHWPFPNYHAPGCDVTSRSPDARPYIHDEFMSTWRQMERLVDMGLVRHIGTSNMTIRNGTAPARREDQTRLQRNGTAPAFSAAGVLPLLYGSPHPADRLLSCRLADAA